MDLKKEYSDKAFGDKMPWKKLSHHDNIQVSILQHPNDPSCPFVKMEAIFPVPVQECWDFLGIDKWGEVMPKLNPFFEGHSTHGEYTCHRGRVHMTLCRIRLKRLGPFGKRDQVFLSVRDEAAKDGSLVSGTVSVHTALVPRQKGYTRAFQDSIGFYKPLVGNTHTALTIIFRIDLNDSSAEGAGGYVPMYFYVQTVGRTGISSMQRMRQALMEMKTQHDQEEANTIRTIPFWRRYIKELDFL
jgi:hypothetical protein